MSVIKKVVQVLIMGAIITSGVVSSVGATGAKAVSKGTNVGWNNYNIQWESSKKLTANKMNKVLKKRGKSSKVRNGNYGKIIMDKSKKYGISPSILFGMFVWETGWGSSYRFTKYNNVGGIKCMRGYGCYRGYATFKSVNQAFDKKASLLSGKLYVGSGRTTYLRVVQRYSPSNPRNYVANVGSIIEKNLGEKPIKRSKIK